MLDLKWICANPTEFDQGLANRGHDATAYQIIALDQKRRALQTELQQLQSQRNTLAKSIGQAHGQKDTVQIETLTQQSHDLKTRVSQLEHDEKNTAEQLDAILAILPNMPASDVPIGSSELDNKIMSTWGQIPHFDFEPKSHDDLGEALNLMNFDRAAAMSGARFTVLTGQLAQLERALSNFMLDVHTQEFNYLQVSPPLLVKDNAFYGVGLLPKFADNAFQTTTGHWLIPTAEVSLTNLVADQILDAQHLPLRFVAHTPCFRSEAGAAGRDTRGMIRQHQFYKVELVSIVDPSNEVQEHERMTTCAQTILERLNLPYRKLLLCTGDMGLQSKKTYDLEVWLPSQNTYREISSCSMCGDYQARRLKARFKENVAQTKTTFVATLNGSGLAVGRTIVAILENYQNKDGSINIPDVLKPYMNNQELIKPAQKVFS